MTTKKRWVNRTFPLLFLLAFVLVLFIQCKSIQSGIQDKLPVESPRALLWRISGNDLAQPSWMYGTIHMIPAEDYFLPEGTLAAFDTATTLFLELDMEELQDPAAQMNMMAQSLMKGDLSLKDLISEEDYSLVKLHFEEMGLPLFFMEKMKPLLLSVFADPQMTPGAFADGSYKIYEMELTDMAKNAGMPVHGLESIEFQLSVMDSIPYEDQAEMLVESIRSEREGNAQFDSLVALYTRQDIEAMIRGIEDESAGDFDELLLDDRNRNWIPVMVKAMQEESCFFAFGAGHLGGPEGVIALLRKEGFVVRPVK